MKTGLINRLSLQVGVASIVVLAGCGTTDPGAGAQAGSYLASNVGPQYAVNKTGLIGWGLLGSFLAGQAESDRMSAAANNAADRARQQQEQEQRPNAVFRDITIEQNVEQNLQKGMIVHMSIETHNLNGANVQPRAYFSHQDGRKLSGQFAFEGPTINPNSEHASVVFPTLLYIWQFLS